MEPSSQYESLRPSIPEPSTGAEVVPLLDALRTRDDAYQDLQRLQQEARKQLEDDRRNEADALQRSRQHFAEGVRHHAGLLDNQELASQYAVKELEMQNTKLLEQLTAAQTKEGLSQANNQLLTDENRRLALHAVRGTALADNLHTNLHVTCLACHSLQEDLRVSDRIRSSMSEQLKGQQDAVAKLQEEKARLLLDERLARDREQARYDKLRSEIDALHRQINQLNKDLEASRQQRLSLQDKLSSTEADKAKVEAELDGEKRRGQQLRMDKDQMERELRAEIAIKHTDVARYQELSRSYQEQLEQRLTIEWQLRAEIHELKAKVEELRTDKEALEKALGRKECDLKCALDEIERLKALLGQQKQPIVIKAPEVQTDTRVSTVKTTINTQEGDIGARQAELDLLRAQLKAKDDELQRLVQETNAKQMRLLALIGTRQSELSQCRQMVMSKAFQNWRATTEPSPPAPPPARPTTPPAAPLPATRPQHTSTADLPRTPTGARHTQTSPKAPPPPPVQQQRLEAPSRSVVTAEEMGAIVGRTVDRYDRALRERRVAARWLRLAWRGMRRRWEALMAGEVLREQEVEARMFLRGGEGEGVGDEFAAARQAVQRLCVELRYRITKYFLHFYRDDGESIDISQLPGAIEGNTALLCESMKLTRQHFGRLFHALLFTYQKLRLLGGELSLPESDHHPAITADESTATATVESAAHRLVRNLLAGRHGVGVVAVEGPDGPVPFYLWERRLRQAVGAVRGAKWPQPPAKEDRGVAAKAKAKAKTTGSPPKPKTISPPKSPQAAHPGPLPALRVPYSCRAVHQWVEQCAQRLDNTLPYTADEVPRFCGDVLKVRVASGLTEDEGGDTRARELLETLFCDALTIYMSKWRAGGGGRGADRQQQRDD
ncbi:unnamed protein product [Vitrella brassicaformis CCMP3155]|uniref:Uncharacterized protein n=3 Tax=Vitrella brassicaformis TaxID=1169539 RepID=A0A0G4EYF8_VITBC|nr:unnamed protein product [Vitrella brassicaformis CCMP3155]|eukprot:CEM04073.1 unnamed protein product [Vitrella brassicaformis CCMP3155]